MEPKVTNRKTEETQKVDEALGARIQYFRKSHGMSCKDLCKQLGVSYQQLTKYENGNSRIGPARLKTLANIFGVSVDELLDMETKEGASDYGMLELAKCYNKIPLNSTRVLLRKIARLLGSVK